MQLIQPGNFVLEIGSGDNPNPRSHILVDKFFEPSPHRKNTPMKIDDRPVLVADVERLPFKDGAFDYVICSHLVEHIPDVGQAFRELMRVARAGYIETPSVYAERIVGKHDIHLWYVYSDGKQLFLNRKTPQNASPYTIPEVFDYLFSDVFWAFPRLFIVRFEWSGTIDYKIISDNDMEEKYRQYTNFIGSEVRGLKEFDRRRLKFGAFLAKREIFNFCRKFFPAIVEKYDSWEKSRLKIKWRFQPQRQAENIRSKLDSVLCCPGCHGNLKNDLSSYLCISCGCRFEVNDGVPNFLQ